MTENPAATRGLEYTWVLSVPVVDRTPSRVRPAARGPARKVTVSAMRLRSRMRVCVLARSCNTASKMAGACAVLHGMPATDAPAASRARTAAAVWGAGLPPRPSTKHPSATATRPKPPPARANTRTGVTRARRVASRPTPTPPHQHDTGHHDHRGQVHPDPRLGHVGLIDEPRSKHDRVGRRGDRQHERHRRPDPPGRPERARGHAQPPP